jgi:hypothetical protein
MKPETFYRKFANLPLAKRDIVGTEGFTPYKIYISLNQAIEEKREAEKEIKRLLEIGQPMLEVPTFNHLTTKT